MFATFKNTRRAGMVLAAVFWVGVGFTVALRQQPDAEIASLLSLGGPIAYFGILLVTYFMRGFACPVFGVLPMGWLVIFVACPFLALPVYWRWRITPDETIFFTGKCPVCGGPAIHRKNLMIYTARYQRVGLGRWLNAYHYRDIYEDIREHKYGVCQACLRKARWSLAALIGGFVVIVIAVPVLPGPEAGPIHWVLALVAYGCLIGGLYAFARWGDLQGVLKRLAMLERAGRSGNRALRGGWIALSAREHRQLQRRGQPTR